jgi:MinD-like ATPase involved in chromosome partitioning or flagellar assembly
VKNKVVAVYGSPGSGKTTLSVKLAGFFAQRRENVIIVSPDTLAPTTPIIVPGYSENLGGLGSITTAGAITADSILRAIAPLPGSKYIGLIAYLKGENIYDYPAYSDDRTRDFYALLRPLADRIIIDLPAGLITDAFSLASLAEADRSVRLCAPELKAVSYFASTLKVLTDRKFGRDEELTALSPLPAGENGRSYEGVFGRVDLSIPKSAAIAAQYEKAELIEKSEGAYDAAISRLAGLISGEPAGNAAPKRTSRKAKKQARNGKSEASYGDLSAAGDSAGPAVPDNSNIEIEIEERESIPVTIRDEKKKSRAKIKENSASGLGKFRRGRL